METSELTTVKVTKTARRLLRLVAAMRGEPMQSAIEDILRAELARLRDLETPCAP